MALLTSTTVFTNYKDHVEIFLAVSEEEEAQSEEEMYCLLLLDTEGPGTPEKDRDGVYHETEHGVAAPMDPPAKIDPPMLENTGQLCGYKYWVREPVKNQARGPVITGWGGTRTG